MPGDGRNGSHDGRYAGMMGGMDFMMGGMPGMMGGMDPMMGACLAMGGMNPMMGGMPGMMGGRTYDGRMPGGMMGGMDPMMGVCPAHDGGMFVPDPMGVFGPDPMGGGLGQIQLVAGLDQIHWWWSFTGSSCWWAGTGSTIVSNAVSQTGTGAQDTITARLLVTSTGAGGGDVLSSGGFSAIFNYGSTTLAALQGESNQDTITEDGSIAPRIIILLLVLV